MQQYLGLIESTFSAWKPTYKKNNNKNFKEEIVKNKNFDGKRFKSRTENVNSSTFRFFFGDIIQAVNP